MTDIGSFNTLRILRMTNLGAVLDGGAQGEVLLPSSEVPAGCEPGAEVDVFVYVGLGENLVATTASPVAQVGQVAHLKIVKVNDAGAFLNWGLPKDLLLPWNEVKREQKRLIVEGRKIMVCIFVAEDGRVAASARLDDFLTDEAEGFKEGDKVDVMVSDPTELGVRVVVNHRHWGLVHTSDIFKSLARGQKLTGYVKALRADGKLNITLSEAGYGKIETVAQGMLRVLKRNGGFLAVGDKTPPEEIYTLFAVSKKVFKQTLGALYKSGKIALEEGGIRLV